MKQSAVVIQFVQRKLRDSEELELIRQVYGGSLPPRKSLSPKELEEDKAPFVFTNVDGR